jgi:hypothetical protein
VVKIETKQVDTAAEEVNLNICQSAMKTTVLPIMSSST